MARTKSGKRVKATTLDFERNAWTPKIAAAWAGMPERTLYRLLQQGAVPCLPMGESQTQKWDKAHDGKRRRVCFRFIIPKVAFIKWWESIGKPNQGGIAA